MKITHSFYLSSIFFGVLAFSTASEAVDVAQGTTLITNGVSIGTNRGHIINNGFIGSNFDNYGIIDSYEDIGEQGFTNHQGGIINIVGYFTPFAWTINNFGTINLLPAVGNYPATSVYMSNGIFNNDGIYRIDTPVDGGGKIINRGIFEITPRGSYQFEGYFDYTQKTGGQTIVDGVLRVVGGLYGLFGGTLSGNGTVIAPAGIVGMASSRAFNISPGSPIGTLTLDTEWITLGSKTSLDIEIAGADSQQYDHFVTNGEIYFYGGITPVNILLREGFVPQAGDIFEIIKAGIIYGSEEGVSFNFPVLPNGLTWEVERTDTSILLKVI